MRLSMQNFISLPTKRTRLGDFAPRVLQSLLFFKMLTISRSSSCLLKFGMSSNLSEGFSILTGMSFAWFLLFNIKPTIVTRLSNNNTTKEFLESLLQRKHYKSLTKNRPTVTVWVCNTNRIQSSLLLYPMNPMYNQRLFY